MRLLRFLGFVAIPAFAAVTPLIGLPALTSVYGSEGWSSVAVGQATGMIGAAFIELGWAWNGPMRVARARGNARLRILSLALLTRLRSLAVIGPVAGAVAFLLSPADPWSAATVALGSSMIGMSQVWYFIGTGRPWRAVLLDGVPRVALVCAAALLLLAGSPLWTYGVVAFVTPSIVSVIAGLLTERVRISHLMGFSSRRISAAIGAQFRAALARGLSAGYMSLPVLILASVTGVYQLGVFAAGDRVSRMILSGLAAIPNGFQGWVGKAATRDERLKRANRAIFVNIGVGVTVGIGSGAVLPAATGFVFSGTATVNPTEAALLGSLIAIVVTSRAVGGIGLVTVGAQRTLLSSSVVGLVVGVPLVAVLGVWGGALGGFIAILTAELVVLAAQLIGYLRETKRAH
ncbi:hypothetical protein [Microbacterium sp. zg.Y909]|uniref:hypothetical protein n=1 Tax=Microbacterium sp. zg.Y909 TaxID=2969413 RepID=UPI00214AFFF9|nr:hypothetical protein [Microbacterium sp. zg.Y909]MCR2823951.1 hypothetical protein [Microbacterium sp. zg.Y909]